MGESATLSGVAIWDPVPETPELASPWRLDHEPLREIVVEACEAVGARFVGVVQRTGAEDLLMSAVWATPDDGRAERVMPATRREVPDFTLHGYRADPRANPVLARVFDGRGEALDSFAALNDGLAPDAFIRHSQELALTRAGVALPLELEGRVVGSLVAHFEAAPARAALVTARSFARRLEQTLRAGALTLRLAAQLEELGRLRRRAVAAEERTRREVAALLHGRAQSRLVVATALLDRGAALLDADPAAARRLLGEARTVIDGVRDDELRPLAARLHPALLRDGLLPALAELAGRLSPALEVRLDATAAVRAADTADPPPGAARLGSGVRLAVYRIVEEALANVLRHARARRAAVTLDLAEEILGLAVEDDGRGLDPATVSHGLGLSSIADRVSLAGGRWVLEGSPGAGTRLRAWLPLSAG